MNPLSLVLLAVATGLLSLIAAVIAMLAGSRQEGKRKGVESRRSSQPSSPAPSTASPAGGGWGAALALPGEGLDLAEEELTGIGPLHYEKPREPVDALRSQLLVTLAEKQGLAFEELEARLQADKAMILDALRELERKGIVRVEGGVVLLDSTGLKTISKLREKYLGKEKWSEEA